MTEDRNDALAEDYLAELARAAAGLPANRRAELLADVRSHIAVAREEAAASGRADDEAVTSDILTQLGDPREIAAAAGADLSPGERKRSFLLENFAVILVLVGAVFGGIGYLIGLLLLWSSKRWTVRDKLIGTLLLPGGLGFPVVVGAMLAFGSVDSVLGSGVWIALVVIMVAVPVWTAVHLSRRARAVGY